MKGWRLVVLLVVAALLVAGSIFIGYRIPLSSERLRREVIATLSDRLESEVELASLELHPFPRMRITGSGLVLRHKRRLDVPLIAVRTFHVTANLRDLLKKRIANVTLEGLEIQVAPGRRDDATGANPPTATAGPDRPDHKNEVVIDTLVADSATVTVLHVTPRNGRRHGGCTSSASVRSGWLSPCHSRAA